MAEDILSVKIEKLIEKSLELLENDESNVDEILVIYNDLLECQKAISECNNESCDNKLNKKIEKCEKTILTKCSKT